MIKPRKIWRNIYLRDWEVLPTGLMKGKIILSYSGSLILGKYDKLPDSYDPSVDMEITCGCDLEELAAPGFKHVDIV